MNWKTPHTTSTSTSLMSSSIKNLPFELIRHIVYQVEDPSDYSHLLLSNPIFRNSLNKKDLKRIRQSFVYPVTEIQKGNVYQKYTLVRCANAWHVYPEDPKDKVRHGRFLYYNSDTGYRVEGQYKRGLICGNWKVWKNWHHGILRTEMMCKGKEVEILHYDDTGKFSFTNDTSIFDGEIYDMWQEMDDSELAFSIAMLNIGPENTITKGRVVKGDPGKCRGTTKKGLRCKFTGWNGGYCHFHKKK